ncbi:hypothetical protein PQO03_08810 [Lentisphaera profundi]|uniref:PH domain-containing protein n=1 Tax=Lentisphaera profundi TaxID=1658616 RepID=A0ABY7VSR2_9BACT|nr:hypothetical protein [Lentisphaera profundi]WDE95814.1 hypothetical protein PQO03_08810 [Lentisphaera profundi]
MESNNIYHYKKNRKQQSKIFINMAVACLIYIAGLYGYEHYLNKTVPENTRNIFIIAFSISSVVLFYVAWWLRAHPANYEAIITVDRFIVKYPDSTHWSFDVKISDIKRFEHRNTLSHAGSGQGASGILLHDGNFHEICMNYGNSINKMYDAIQSIDPNITFPKKVNKKISGLITKDFDN